MCHRNCLHLPKIDRTAAYHDFSAPGFAEDLLSRNHNAQAKESQINIVPTFADCVGVFVQQKGSVPSRKSSDILFVVILDIVCAAIAIKKLQTILVGFWLSIATKPCRVY